MTGFTIALEPFVHLTDEQFFQICQANREVKFERSPQGELIIMPLTGGATGKYNANLNAQLWNWNEQARLGEVFDSSTCFRLPNGADRSPDAAWVQFERWNSLTLEQQEKFPPICPDFVVELRSPSDSLQSLQAKMQEYRENGAQLGWLINCQDCQVEIYRSGQPVEILQSPATISGESILPGFYSPCSGFGSNPWTLRKVGG
ncbi:MAG: Uma2 family endonuclease [Oscillatoriophycideae cyanobacterium NC_groundwater_1537_Pr4_S-0.65um_50_18]|nr:Uma2 family endonuclease [Oscillatoriophycideae cyanobacterium NC_groundwater_1537_Pr4_S-0.65um_50_18]